MCPLAWYALPVATHLHPVGPGYGARYQELVEETVQETPILYPTFAEADLYWRLYMATGEGAWLSDEAPEAWRQAAAAASTLAALSLVDETLQRSPIAWGVYTFVDTIVSPSLSFTRNRHGVEVAPVRDLGPRQRLAQRSAQSAEDRTRAPTVAFGGGFRAKDEEAPEEAPLYQYTTWLMASRPGAQSVRVDWYVGSGRLMLSARQTLVRDLQAYLTTSPEAWSGGLLYTVAPRVTVRLATTSTSMMLLQLQGSFPTPAPGRVDPPLGQAKPVGLQLPAPPEREPLTVVRLPTRIETWDCRALTGLLTALPTSTGAGTP